MLTNRYAYTTLAPLLNGIAMDAASEEPATSPDELINDLGLEREADFTALCDTAYDTGLLIDSDKGERGEITLAGKQYLATNGDIDEDVLRFLPHDVQNLHSRQALHAGGKILIAQFTAAIADNETVDHARGMMPDAYVSAVDGVLATRMFSAGVALMVRLTEGRAAACIAEEVMAVNLIRSAELWLEMERAGDKLDGEEVDAAIEGLADLFEMFDSDDALELFQFQEPADAAVMAHDAWRVEHDEPDLKLASWFEPFGGLAHTGYLTGSESHAQPTNSQGK